MMEELTFEGVPLGELTAPPGSPPAQQSTRPPAARPGSGPITVPPAAPAATMAEQLQRAHAAVLDTHRAISAWQLARTAMLTGTAEVLRTDGPYPTDDGPAPLPRHEIYDGTAAVLETAANALPGDGTGAIDLTWRNTVPDAPTALDAHPATGSGGPPLPSQWYVRDGDRVIAVVARHPQAPPWPRRPVPRYPRDPRPLARTSVERLSAAELDALAAGEFATVFGAAFDQRGLSPEALPAPWPARLLAEVTAIEPRGGVYAQGFLRATAHLTADERTATWPRLIVTASELLRVYAFHRGFHLCLPGARTTPLTDRPALVELFDTPAPQQAELRLEMEVTELGMVPRPYLIGDCRITGGGQLVAHLRDLGITLRERPGADLAFGLKREGCRRSAAGQWAVCSELVPAVAAEGNYRAHTLHDVRDLHGTAQVRPRLPRGDMLMLDRCRQAEIGAWREYRPGSWLASEHDVPEDPWYVRESGGALPQLALMEIALQPPGIFSGLLGVLGEYPDQDLTCRNLDGTARLLREVDPRGATVEQQTTLTSHTPLPGGLMHRYNFSLGTGGKPFYTGETVHGYFTPELLAQQQGLDGGRRVPPWLDRCPPPPAQVRHLDLREDTRLGHGRMALLEDTVLVPDGGVYGAGYLLCTKPVRPDDWYFEQHFFQDPVMPGSAGVQMLYQAAHAYALHTGLVDHLLPHPHFAIAAGEEVRWTYRGQILREHRQVRGEVHIREVHHDGRAVRILADGSVWRDDLRIYQVDNIAVQVTSARRNDRGEAG
ncbi:3-hydroxyacyl-ACP dehydratase [Streptomyces sp. cg2]|uniref:3-hydroxyacyl-ACP dehydratase n=1 Tax=Streptomyces sp. cg2 TaxID=3238799 RepID=UPI0034E25ADF